MKKKFYQVEFERKVQKEFYEGVSPEKIANFHQTLDKKGVYKRDYNFREILTEDDKNSPQNFDYSSVQNVFDRLLI